MKQADVWRKKAEARREELRAEYQLLSEKINETTLSYIARAGETGKLYGSITTSQITDDLNDVLGTDIDRRKVGVEPLRQLGEHKVIIRLSADFQPFVTVLITPEEGSPGAHIISEEVEEIVAETLEEIEAADIETIDEETVEEDSEEIVEEIDAAFEEETDESE
jgi:large subunit ribosomal protein L9